MKLSTVFDALSYGELSQLSIGGAETQGITVDNHKNILAHINLGLTALHTRFLLKERKINVPLIEGKSLYILEPVEQDILKIERVMDYLGRDLSLNNEEDRCSIQTPSFNVLDVPLELDREMITVQYRANHPEITKGNNRFIPSEVEVDLPISHLEALLYFVASRLLNPIGVIGEGFHEGNNYASKYEQACQRLEAQNYRIDKRINNSRFERNGWV